MTHQKKRQKAVILLQKSSWAISITRLAHFCLPPVTYQRGSLPRPLIGNLILKPASCLDAFSTYPNRT